MVEPVEISMDALRPGRQVEVFLRVKGRLPDQEGDELTREICMEFIKRFPDHSLRMFAFDEIGRMAEDV